MAEDIIQKQISQNASQIAIMASAVEALRQSVIHQDKRLAETERRLFDKMDDQATSIYNKIDEQTKTFHQVHRQDRIPPSFWLTGLAVVLTIMTMAGALVMNSIESAQVLNQAKHETIQIQVSANNQLITVLSQDRFSGKDHERFSANAIVPMRADVTSNSDAIRNILSDVAALKVLVKP